MRLNLPILAFASITLLMVACSTPVTRGYLHDQEAIKTIKPGTSTKDAVQEALGSPSSQSTYGLMTWYYVSSTKSTRSLLPAKITDQHVTEVAFDGSGIVTSVKEYTLADGKKVDMVTRVTPTEGQQLGFFEQILGNLGRFNKEGGSGVSNRHGGSGGPNGPPGGR